MTRRDYKTGSVYQRRSDWRWIGTIEDGWNADGGRRRIPVSAKGCEGGCKERCPHRAEIMKRLRDKRAAMERGEVGTTGHTTVKQWTGTYLDMRLHDLAPKAWNAAASPLRRWVVPTIGHRRLGQLTPADVRAVHDVCRKAGRQSADVHRALRAMLNAAMAEGHAVAPRVLAVKAPHVPKSDREAMSVEEGIACLEVASTIPHGVRWVFTLLYGARLGECLGLTWDAVDLDAGEAVIEWQLQPLPCIHGCDEPPTCGKTHARSCPDREYREPDAYEKLHLVDSFHLVRPKSRAGHRVAPLLPPVRDALMRWSEVAPSTPHGLVWPTLAGRPANDKHDREEWHALQGTAGVGHPAGRPYHVHECRNFAATMLLDAEVPEHVVADLLGHTTVATSLRYRTRRREPLREAMERVGERLQLG